MMTVDPIQREDFNIRRGREANPERIKRIKFLARRQRLYKSLLAVQVREAIETGHSYRQVAEAAGCSPTAIQHIVQGGQR